MILSNFGDGFSCVYRSTKIVAKPLSELKRYQKPGVKFDETRNAEQKPPK